MLEGANMNSASSGSPENNVQVLFIVSFHSDFVLLIKARLNSRKIQCLKLASRTGHKLTSVLTYKSTF